MENKTRFATVVVLLAALGAAGCEVYEEPFPPRDGLYYPIGVQMHPEGRFLYVVNSNFDLLYRDELGGTVSVYDTEEGEFLPDATPFIPSFGGHIALNQDATQAYVTSRRADELTVLSVADQGQGLYCEVGGEPEADTRPCTTNRIPDSRDGATIPTDPFGIAVGHVERVRGEDLHGFDTVHMSHLAGREVTSATFSDDTFAGATMASAGLIEGGGAQIRIRPGTEEVYVAGRGADRVDGYSPYINDRGEVEAIVRGDSVQLTGGSASTDARGLDFDDDGDWMYVATRSPSALHIVGMDDAAGPEVVNSIPLESRPSEVHFHRGADGVDRIYVPSYGNGTVAVVEPGREAVVDTIEVGRSPYSMAFDPTGPHCRETGERCRGYVTLFDAAADGADTFSRCGEEDERCGRVAVIDLDPESDDFHTVIDTIE